MTAILSLGFAFASFVVLAQGWEYGLDHYHSAPHYQAQSQYELSTCPHTGPEGLVCAGITGSEPFTFPNACEVARFRTVTGKDWQIIHEGRCDNLEVCPGHCRNQYNPVCGKLRNERRNFNSECELQLVKCRTGDPWRKQHDGPCESRYPAGQSPRVRSYNPYAVSSYQSHQGYSGSQRSYGQQGSYEAHGSQGSYGTQGTYGSYGTHGSQASYGTQGSYGTQEPYGSQASYGTHGGYGSQGSDDSHRSFVPYGPYSPFAISSQSQPSFVSPPPPYKAPVYYPYEITWENLPTEFGIHDKSYGNLPTEYPAPGSKDNSYERVPTDNVVTPKPYEEPAYEKPTYEKPTYDSPTSTDKPTYENPAYDSPTSADKPTYDNPTYENPAYDSPTSADTPTYKTPTYEPQTTSTTSRTTPTTSTTTTEKTAVASTTTTPKPEPGATTESLNPRQNIKINAVVEAPVSNSTNNSTTTTSPVTVKPAPLEKYATTASPQHATTTPRTTFDKVIKVNAVQEKSNSTTTTTTKAPKITPTTHKAPPSYGYQGKTSYKSSPIYTTTTEPQEVTKTTGPSFDKVIKINAVLATTPAAKTTEEPTTEEPTTEEPTTEEPTTEEPTTEESTTYRSYPTYQSPSSYSSYSAYPAPTSYKSPPAYGSYAASPSYKSPPVYTTTEKPKVTGTTLASFEKIIKINAVKETTPEEPTISTEEPTTSTEEPTTSTTEEATTSTTEEATTHKSYPTVYDPYPSYPAQSSHKTSYKSSPVVTTTESPKATEPDFEKVIKINAIKNETSEAPKETSEAPEETSDSSTEESTTTEEPTTYPSNSTYQVTSYATNGTYPAYPKSSYNETSGGYSSQATYEEPSSKNAYAEGSPVIVKTINGSTFTKMYVEVPGKQGPKKFSLETSSGDNKSLLQQIYFLTFN